MIADLENEFYSGQRIQPKIVLNTLVWYNTWISKLENTIHKSQNSTFCFTYKSLKSSTYCCNSLYNKKKITAFFDFLMFYNCLFIYNTGNLNQNLPSSFQGIKTRKLQLWIGKASVANMHMLVCPNVAGGSGGCSESPSPSPSGVLMGPSPTEKILRP